MDSKEIILKAENRTVTGKKVNALRRSGLLPGVIYGRHLEALAIQMDFKQASKTISHLTSSSLVIVEVGKEKHTAIVRDRQKDVVLGHLLHVDFLAVSLTEKLRTNVNIELIGESPAEMTMDAVVVQSLNELEIECLPQDLPERIEVDISILETTSDVILVSSIVLSDKITILTDPNEVIASVTHIVQEVEEEPEVDELEELLEEGAEPEVIEHGKKEEETGEES
ncbi:MAG: 50S ribosomal protein L25 [Chloroflexota bacterium]